MPEITEGDEELREPGESFKGNRLHLPFPPGAPGNPFGGKQTF